MRIIIFLFALFISAHAEFSSRDYWNSIDKALYLTSFKDGLMLANAYGADKKLNDVSLVISQNIGSIINIVNALYKDEANKNISNAYMVILAYKQIRQLPITEKEISVLRSVGKEMDALVDQEVQSPK